MKKTLITPAIIMMIFANAFSQEVVELKIPNSNKVVIKLMFRNGSITDPEGKEGLTAMTTRLAHGPTAS